MGLAEGAQQQPQHLLGAGLADAAGDGAAGKGSIKKGKPTSVLFQWGQTWHFQAVITDIEQQFTLFMPDGTPVRFVQQGADVYAILLGLPGARIFGLRGIDGRSVDAAHIVGSRARVGIGERDGMVEITLPERVPVEPAYALHLGSGVRWNG